MNVSAMVFAGGSGKRMKINSVPKQFMELNGKPIIIYTLEHFERNEQINNIAVSCIKGWENHLKELLEKFHITKVKWIVEGGNTGQESIFNGLKVLYENNPKDTIVLVHDGVRPLINDELINDNIKKVIECGNAITVAPAIETIMTINHDSKKVLEMIDRHSCMLARAPQSFYLKDLYNAHLQMQAQNRNDLIDSATMMKECGYELYVVDGPAENIKITTPTDFYMFKAFVEADLLEEK